MENRWQETIVENHRTPILDQVCFRIDFPAWLESLLPRDRKIARALTEGERTTDLVARFGVSIARNSQHRGEFEKSWLAFQAHQQLILIEENACGIQVLKRLEAEVINGLNRSGFPSLSDPASFIR